MASPGDATERTLAVQQALAQMGDRGSERVSHGSDREEEAEQRTPARCVARGASLPVRALSPFQALRVTRQVPRSPGADDTGLQAEGAVTP